MNPQKHEKLKPFVKLSEILLIEMLKLWIMYWKCDEKLLRSIFFPKESNWNGSYILPCMEQCCIYFERIAWQGHNLLLFCSWMGQENSSKIQEEYFSNLWKLTQKTNTQKNIMRSYASTTNGNNPLYVDFIKFKLLNFHKSRNKSMISLKS